MNCIRYMTFVLSFKLLVACSSGSGLLISSTPAGAKVVSSSGEVLGETPLALTGEKEKQITASGLFQFKVSERGYIPKHIFLDASDVRNVNVALTPISSESFKGEFASDFALELNQLLRSAFEIQKLMNEDPQAAAEAVEAFKKQYPQLAYGYMLAAHFATLKGDRELARNNILQAQELDPEDPTITQALNLLRRTPSE